MGRSSGQGRPQLPEQALMTRTRWSAIIILVLVLLTALGVYLLQAVEEPQNALREAVPVPVEVLRIRPQTFTYRLEALGTVQALREAAIGVKVSGPIAAIPPEIALGARLEAGQLIAEIDPTPFRIEVNQREAGLARARAQARTRQAEIARQRNLIGINRDKLRLSQAEYDRLRSLYEAGGIAWVEVKAVELALRRTEEEVERVASGLAEAQAQLAVAEADVAAALAEVARAREALADTQIRAPFAGIVARKSVTLGEQVRPGAILAELADIGTVKLLIRVPADDVAFLRLGAEAEIAAAGLPGPLTGRVGSVGPRADAETRTFPAEILVVNRGARPLLPGMFARATLAVRTYPQAILLPRSSVLDAEGTPAVFVAEAGLARRRPLRIARIFGPRLLVGEGVAEGDLVIIVGQRLLHDGAAVRIVETREPAP